MDKNEINCLTLECVLRVLLQEMLLFNTLTASQKSALQVLKNALFSFFLSIPAKLSKAGKRCLRFNNLEVLNTLTHCQTQLNQPTKIKKTKTTKQVITYQSQNHHTQ